MNRVHFSSQTCRWATPQWLFNELNEEFGFTLDAAADSENAKCKRYLTAEDDGTFVPWSGVVWCNPPYGNVIGEFLEKAVREKSNGITSVHLIPARTDTRWFHAYVLPHATEIRFIKGRLRFGGAKHNAPFPSMIVIYRSHT